MNQNYYEYYRCPGKVLLLGGYAILNDENHGLSVAVEKYFYSYAHRKKSATTKINFHSINFQSTWTYGLEMEAVNLISGKENPYLSAVCKVIAQQAILLEKGIPIVDLNVYIKADQEFYNPSQLNKQTSKTGLGSSSALIVVCLAALLENFTIDVAMLANQIAQNKIGSGFDISTCYSGTQVYRRPKENQLVPQLNQTLNLHDKYELFMVDLGIGHDTISAVKGFQKYLNENEEIKLSFYAQSEDLLKRLLLALQSDDQQGIKSINRKYRTLQQQFCQFEIEPKISGDIIDKLIENFDEVNINFQLNQILYGVCPGAGGYDSIAILVWREKSQEDKYVNFLKENFQHQPCLFKVGICEKGLQKLGCTDMKQIMGELTIF